MIVVADSSPLHYLILVGEADLLRQLYGDVIVPDAVAAELTRPASPPVVATWVSAPPSWVKVTTVTPEEIASVPEILDLGERAAIALAETMRGDRRSDRGAPKAHSRHGNSRCTTRCGGDEFS